MKVLLLAENRLTAAAAAAVDGGGNGGFRPIPFLTTLEYFEASLIILAGIFLPQFCSSLL